jgi:hypothetical protein
MATYRVITGGGQFIDSHVSVYVGPILAHLADIAPPRLE